MNEEKESIPVDTQSHHIAKCGKMNAILRVFFSLSFLRCNSKCKNSLILFVWLFLAAPERTLLHFQYLFLFSDERVFVWLDQ